MTGVAVFKPCPFNLTLNLFWAFDEGTVSGFKPRPPLTVISNFWGHLEDRCDKV